MPHKANAARRHHIPRPKRRGTNSADYDAALRKRGSLTVWFTAEAIAAWKAAPRATPGGQPAYSDLAITTALTVRAVFRLALRQTEGLIDSILQLLGLDLPVPDHTTLGRRARTPALQARHPTGGAIHLLVDSTGLKLCGPGERLIGKHGTRKRRSWRKLHIGMDAASGRIVAATLTDRAVDDAAQVGPLLDQVADPVAALLGDGAYDRNGVYADMQARHPEAAVIVPPRRDAVLSDTAESALREPRRERDPLDLPNLPATGPRLTDSVASLRNIGGGGSRWPYAASGFGVGEKRQYEPHIETIVRQSNYAWPPTGIFRLQDIRPHPTFVLSRLLWALLFRSCPRI
ncbi:IS5 family transposase [Azospirillum brasilense]|uniref:IS5 family transposase n=1 Tax=Azospirillum brasilense TaxID=192 RepID=UPI001FFFC45F|nr:IS5 family transposase [Azospirillum brasilense]